MDKDMKICVNCGFINKPAELMCANCGNNLLTDPSDPMQVYKSEANIVGLLLKGDYERKFLPLTFSIIIGIMIIFFSFLIFSIVIQSTVDFPGWVVIITYFILASIGAWLIFQALKKLFLRNRRNIIVEILIAFLLVIGLFFIFRFAINETTNDNLITVRPSIADTAEIAPSDNKIIGDLSESLNFSQDIPANWQTYENKDLAISFKYPDISKISQSENNNVKFLYWNDKDALMYFNTIADVGNVTGKIITATTIDELLSGDSMALKKIGTTSIGGETVTIVLESALGGDNYDLYFMRNNHLYILQFVGQESLTDLQNKFISTIRFLD